MAFERKSQTRGGPGGESRLFLLPDLKTRVRQIAKQIEHHKNRLLILTFKFLKLPVPCFMIEFVRSYRVHRGVVVRTIDLIQTH